MAGNRLQRTGSIFFRLNGLIRADAIKKDDIPLWYEVYKAFPPKYDPDYGRPTVMKEIKPIYYHEDIIRGKFAKVYGSLGHNDLLDGKTKLTLQRFVEKYQEFEKKGNYSNDDDMFSAVEKSLSEEGLILKRIDKVVDDEKEEQVGT